MNNRVISLSVLIIVLFLIFTGCSETEKTFKEKPISNEVTEDSKFKSLYHKLEVENFEELKIEDSKILKEDSLNITQVKEGIFYGISHKPAGDGIKLKSLYKFDFNGNISETIEEEYLIDINNNLFPFINDKCYYFQESLDGKSSDFMKLNYMNMVDEHIFSISYLTPRFFQIVKDDLYYVRNNAIYKRNLKSGIEEIIYELNSYSYKFFVDNGEIYIFVRIDNNSENLIKLKASGEVKVILEDSFRLITKINNYIYYAKKIEEDKYILNRYNKSSGEFYEVGYIESPNNKIYALSKKIVYEDDRNTIHILNIDNKELKYKVDEHFKDISIIDVYKENYILYETISDKIGIGIIDLQGKVNYYLDISKIDTITDAPSNYTYYIDDNYMYLQSKKEFVKVPEQIGDRFFRVKLKNFM